VVNALRYTPDGGSVTITAEPAGGGVLFSVVDNGSGIDPAELPLIFERFHRADKSRHTESGETGLGLAIVKAIVEAHGGRVEAQSQVDGGTRVDVWLPAISATG
jgi:signal transduction histidine kinase